MPGDIDDMHIGIKAVDPALADHSCDPKHLLPASEHAVEPPPVYEGHAIHQHVHVDGILLPTEEELRTLKRVPAKIPWKVYTIAFIELVERMSYYGTLAVMINFLQKKNPGTRTGAAPHPNDPESRPGALGLGQQVSTGISTFNSFWVYLMPLLGAFVADTYLGRFRTIVLAVVIAEIGHVLLTASAAPALIAKPKNSLSVFIVGLVIMGIGTGMFKPNISPLIAEQIPTDVMLVETNKKGERVIVDPGATIVRIYNYFYLFINIGALIGQVGMAYAERYVGYYLSYLVPTIFFLATFPVLVYCRNKYVRRAPDGNVIGTALRLFFFALRGRWHVNPLATWRHWNDGTFWEHVKPSYLGAAKPSWMIFDDAWVDEVARGYAACSVFLWYPLYWLTYNQINNNLTSQAGTMTLNGVPNDVISNLDPFALIILIPLIDLLVYPALRRRGIRFTPIKKIAAGFFLGTAAMIWAAVLQYYIYKTGPCGTNNDGSAECRSPIIIWAQTGSYVLIATSEIFASITSLEYAFTKAPKNMRSFVQAFSLLMSAFSATIGEAFLPLANNPLLVWNYAAPAIISFVGGCLFYLQYRQLDKDEDRLNMLPTGHLGTEAQAVDVERRLSTAGDKKSS